LVPDDVLVFAAGDAIGADARVFETARLAVAEAALTGESVPVEKHTRVLDVHTPVPDRRNMVYAGTHVTSGRGRAVVVATGVETEVGKIAVLTQSAEEPKTPLEMRIAQFGRYLIYAAVFLFVFIVGLGWLRDVSFVEIVMIGISQVVSMIPAGLPVALTIALAVGVQRMAARNTIVRRLSAVETLGSTNIICSDKTGTLTKNEMTVTSVCLPDGRSVDVGGDVNTDPQLKPLFEALALCNDAQLRTGDPTETSLITLALKAKIKVPELRRSFPRLAEIPFDPDVKMMATQHRKGSGNIVYVKGAPEVVLRLCRGLAPDDLRRLENVVADMAERSLRVLAAAKIENMAGLITDFVLLRGKAEFIGLVGQLDPPRPEVKVAVDECKKAGIRPVMVTGDHKSTGWAIARELGIAREGDLAVDGVELDRMDDRVLLNCLDRIAVFARVHPAQKLRIVEAYQAKKAVVAMTGDGVNDAPALARANVGVAMGITGTEVAKEAAKIVIADDNFATIVKAVEEGRLIYRNIKKLILYLFSTSAAEIVILVAALLAGYPPPLVAVQILWVNLVTDGAVTVTLIMEPLEVMR
jgi:Ca2+-transporting ATPase